jgi:DNA transposition AAA+ family ATPase
MLLLTNYSSFILDMKSIIVTALGILGMLIAGCQPTKVAKRDYAYEAYCDSIWEANPDYYMDVLMETDEYCEYIEQNGRWWKD